MQNIRLSYRRNHNLSKGWARKFTSQWEGPSNAKLPAKPSAPGRLLHGPFIDQILPIIDIVLVCGVDHKRIRCEQNTCRSKEKIGSSYCCEDKNLNQYYEVCMHCSRSPIE